MPRLSERKPTLIQQIRWGISANTLLTKEQWALIDAFEGRGFAVRTSTPEDEA